MPDINPTSQPLAPGQPSATPTAPQPQPPSPDPNTVLAPTPVSSLPDVGEGYHKIATAILAILLVVAVAIAVWQFVPWPHADTPQPAPSLSTVKIETSLEQVEAAFDDLDANMIGIDPALTDTQGNLSE